MQAENYGGRIGGNGSMSDLLPVRSKNLNEEDLATLSELLKVWRAKRPKNLSLSLYHDSKQRLRDLGISLPPSMRSVHAALGWPQKAVSALARKHVFEGFSLNGQTDPFDMNELLDANRFELEFAQAVNSAYKHSCSFITTTTGNTDDGEPSVLVHARSAEYSAAVWDKRRRDLKSFLAITDIDEHGMPTAAVMMTRTHTHDLKRESGSWTSEATPNNTGRVLAEPIAYDPQIDRPFGRSRITREVRYLTDAGVRTLLRTETSAEFYASPQRYALGADESSFQDQDRWKVILGHMLALGVNELGEIPTVGQFSQMSMEPHLSMYRQLAQNFCSATGLPQSSVGLFADNPASAEAMQAAEAALSDEAEYQWRVFRPQLKRTLQNVWMLAENVKEPHPEMWKVNTNWTPARYVSPQAASDWAVKVASVDEDLKGTSVIRRRMGLSQGEIEEVEAERRRTAGPSILDRVLAREPGAEPVEAESE